MILVVGTHQAIDVRTIDWNQLSAVVLVRCVSNTGTFDTKSKLREQTTRVGIPLHLAFAITQPPIENVIDVPRELMQGFGLIYDKEVMIYGERPDHIRDQCGNEDEVTTNSG